MVVVRGAGIARVSSVNVVVESLKDLDGLRGGHVEEAAPDFVGRKAAGREPRDDAEVVRATFEGAPQVRVGRCRSGDDGTGG